MKKWAARLDGKISEADLRFKTVYEQNVILAFNEKNPDLLKAPFELYRATRAPKGLSEEGELHAYKAYLKRIGAVSKE